MATDPFAGLWSDQGSFLDGQKRIDGLPVYGPPTPWWIKVRQDMMRPPKPQTLYVSPAQYKYLMERCDGRRRYKETE